MEHVYLSKNTEHKVCEHKYPYKYHHKKLKGLGLMFDRNQKKY